MVCKRSHIGCDLSSSGSAAILLWITWPYRWLFIAKTGKIHYTLKKKIYKSATSTNEIADSAIAELVVLNTSSPYVLVPYPPLDTALSCRPLLSLLRMLLHFAVLLVSTGRWSCSNTEDAISVVAHYAATSMDRTW